MAKLSVRQWKVVSLFAGIGGIDLAFEQVGFQIIWANEIDRFACQTYRANFPNHKLVEGDIRKIDVKDISPHDILTAGFPCQPFSLAQSDKDKKGLKHKSGNLFLEIVRVLEYHKPSMFLLENVKGLTFKNNKEVFDIILNSLKDLGYYVKWEILGAHTHGNIPQSRNRVFIIGFRDKERFDSFEFPKPIPLTTKLSEVIDFSLEQEDKYYYSPSKHKFYSQLKEGIEQEERERERERDDLSVKKKLCKNS